MTDQGTLVHVFLTRFNMPSGGVEARIRAQEGWLRDRWSLFERYTVPCMREQTAPRAAWLVYLDPLSPQWLVDNISTLSEEGLLTALYREAVDASALLYDIRRASSLHGAARLLTTNIDNDDALSSDFSARVQRAAGSLTDPVAIYVGRGLIRDGQKIYLRRARKNAFCSVVDSGDQPLTCWADWHNRLPLLMKSIHVWGPPGWMQVVHGGNVSNRARGRLVSPRRYLDSFPASVFAGLMTTTRRQIVRDAFVGAPVRYFQGQSRALARSMIVRILGKERYEALKNRLF